MTRMRLPAAAALLLLLGPLANAQDLKIGFVNVPFLLQNAPQTQAVDQRLQSEFAPREAELTTQLESLREKAARLERDGAVMSAQERGALEREIEQGDRDLQRQQAIFQEDASIRQEELLGELQRVIAQRIQAFAEEEDYDLILANVVYASEAVDITEDVLEALEEAAE